jgi:hypothetical protein
MPAFERCDSKRERITRELMSSFECPFSWWHGPGDAEARDRGSDCVRDATGRVGLASNDFREDTPPGTGCETCEGAEEGSPGLFRRYVDQNLVLVDSGQGAVARHRSIMTSTGPTPPPPDPSRQRSRQTAAHKPSVGKTSDEGVLGDGKDPTSRQLQFIAHGSLAARTSSVRTISGRVASNERGGGV